MLTNGYAAATVMTSTVSCRHNEGGSQEQQRSGSRPPVITRTHGNKFWFCQNSGSVLFCSVRKPTRRDNHDEYSGRFLPEPLRNPYQNSHQNRYLRGVTLTMPSSWKGNPSPSPCPAVLADGTFLVPLMTELCHVPFGSVLANRS